MYHLSARTNVKFIRADTETLADRTLSEKSIKHCKSQCNIFHIHTNKMQLASGEPPAFALYIHMHIYIYNIILHMQNYRYTNWIISDHRHTYIYIYIVRCREGLSTPMSSGAAQRFSTIGARSRNRLGCLGSATLCQEQAPKPRGFKLPSGYD